MAVFCIRLKRGFSMFRVFNKTKIVENYQHFVMRVRKVSSLSGTKLNSASRITICVTEAGSMNSSNATLQNGGFRVSSELQRRLFHVTASRQALPPVFIIILRPLSKIAAILFGRAFRKWWGALPPDRKQNLLLRFKRNKMALLGELTLCHII
jgi:hypothetical protein